MNKDLYDRLDRFTSEHLKESLSRPEQFTDEARDLALRILKERGESFSAPRHSNSTEIEKSDSAKTLYNQWMYVTLAVNLIPLAMLAIGLPWLLVIPTYIGIFALSFHLKGKYDSHPDSTTIESGLSPLMKAAASGDLSRAQELLEAGASPNAVDTSGATSLMYAARNNQTEMIKLLIRLGADSQVRTKKGHTALWFAQKNGHAEAVSLLQ